jgi:hypothetical protein
MAARSGDLERPLGALLSFDVAKVEPGRARDRKTRLRRRQELGSLEVVDDGQQGRRRNDFDLARPRRLATACSGADNTDLQRFLDTSVGSISAT